MCQWGKKLWLGNPFVIANTIASLIQVGQDSCLHQCESAAGLMQVIGNSFLHQCEDPSARLSIVRTLLRFPACLPGKFAVPQTLKLTNDTPTQRASYHLVTDDDAGRFPLFRFRCGFGPQASPLVIILQKTKLTLQNHSLYSQFAEVP